MSAKKGARPGTQSVLGQQAERGPRIKSPKQTKAGKYFQQASKPPTLSVLPTSATPTAPQRTAKPLVQDLPVYNPDDPMIKIEEAASRIGNIVKDYETSQEESNARAMQEMDSVYQINSMEPDQILQQSKQVVDDLISRNKELKDTQSDMLSSLYTWLHREEKILSDQEDNMKQISHEPVAINATSNDLLTVLTSSEGTTQERVSKAMVLHSDMMSKAFLAITHLENKINEQQRLINDLTEQNKVLSQGHRKRKPVKQPEVPELKAQLESYANRIQQQDETIKRLNQRVEQLIGQSVHDSARSKGSQISEEEVLMLQHDNFQNRIAIETLENSYQEAKDEIFKLKHRILTVEAEKEYFEVQNQTLLDRIDIERQKYDQATRDYLNKINELGHPDNSETEEKIAQLKKAIDTLQSEKEESSRRAHDEMNKRLQALKREYEIRELELKKRSIGHAIGSQHQAVLEMLQKQHDEEMKVQQQHFDELMGEQAKDFQNILKSKNKECEEKIKAIHEEMNQKMAQIGGKDTAGALAAMQSQYDKRELELKEEYLQKIDMIRQQFQRNQKKLEDELFNRENEIQKMMKLIATASVPDSRLPSPPPEKNDEEEDSTSTDIPFKSQIDEAVKQYAEKMNLRFERKQNELKDQLDRYYYEELQSKDVVIEELNKSLDQLQAENNVLKSGELNDEIKSEIDGLKEEISEKKNHIEQLNHDIEVLKNTKGDASEVVVIQSNEIDELQQRYDDVANELQDLKSMKTNITLVYPKALLDISEDISYNQSIDIHLDRSLPSQISIAPTIDSLERAATPQTHVVELNISSQDPLFIQTMSQYCSVTCQADLVETSKIIQRNMLFQPTLEVISIKGIEISPEEPVIIQPSSTNIIIENSKKKVAKQLLTQEGQLIDVPAISSVTQDTHPAASNVVAKLAIDETQELTKHLQLVVSELQSIEEESDQKKKLQMQETVALSLEIEKDAVISQMREKITELEQMLQRIDEQSGRKEAVSSRSSGILVDAWEIATQTMDLGEMSDLPTGAIEVHQITKDDLDSLTYEQQEKITQNLVQTGTDAFDQVIESDEAHKDNKSRTPQTSQKSNIGIEHSPDFTNNQQAMPDYNKPSLQFSQTTNQTEIGNNQNSSEVESKPSLQLSTISGYSVSMTGLILPTPNSKVAHANHAEYVSDETQAASDIKPNYSTTETQAGQELASLDSNSAFVFEKKDSVPPTPGRPVLSLSTTNENISERKRVTIKMDNTSSQCLVGAKSDASTITSRPGSTLLSVRNHLPLSVIRVNSAEVFQSEPSPHKVVRIMGGIVESTQTKDAPTQLSIEQTLNFNSQLNEVVDQIFTKEAEEKPKPVLTHFTTQIEPVVDIKATQQRVKIDMKKIPKAHHKNEDDARIQELKAQKCEIQALKQQLMALQSSTPETQGKVLAKIQESLDVIGEKLEKVEEPTIVITQEPKAPTEEIKTDKLGDALQTANTLTNQFLFKQNESIGHQVNMVNKMNNAAIEFANEMEKQGGATTDEQSTFLRKVNNLTSQFGSTVAALQSEVANDGDIRKAFDIATTELKKQESIIMSLQNEIIDLKTCKDAPRITLQMKQVQEELSNLLTSRTENNQMFKKTQDAARIIGSLMQQAKVDSTTIAAGASSLVDKVAKSVMQTRPDWNSIQTNVNELVNLLESENTRKRAEQHLKDITESNRLLIEDNQKLRTEKIISDRDLAVEKAKNQREIDQIQKSLHVALQQNEMLERQMKSSNLKTPANSVEKDAFDKLKKELEVAHNEEKQKMIELQEVTKENETMQKELANLTKKCSDLQERYQSLFSQATDTQTSNQVLEARTNELIKRAEIDANKIRTYEQIANETTNKLDMITHKYTKSMLEKERLQKQVMMNQQKIDDLETKLLRLKSRDIKPESSEAPKFIKVYQQRAEMFQAQLTLKGNELMKYQAKHAEDARNLVMIQHELQRAKNDLRMQALRFESSKSENDLAQKNIAARDDTIRALKREIERLRSLLAMQGPLKQKMRLVDRERNENAAKIAQTKQNITKFGNFNSFLERQQQSLVRLERRRKEIMQAEEQSKLGALRAMQYLARPEELAIPEETVFQMMPKPAPVKSLQNRYPKPSSRIKQETLDFKFKDVGPAPQYQPTSYADALQQIGQLAGQVSPRTLSEMLRQARHKPGFQQSAPPPPPEGLHKRKKQQPMMGITITPYGRKPK